MAALPLTLNGACNESWRPAPGRNGDNFRREPEAQRTYSSNVRSKRSNRVRGRSGAAANGQWSCGQQELPSVPGRCRISERLQIAVIEEMHAEIHKREIMNGAAQLRWRNILRMIAAEDGDVALLEPGDD